MPVALSGIAATVFRQGRAVMHTAHALAGRRCSLCSACMPYHTAATARPLSQPSGWHQTDHICQPCRTALQAADNTPCPQCGMPRVFYGDRPEDIPCPACKQRPPSWERLFFYGWYEGLLQKCLVRYKFRKQFGLIRVLQSLAVQALYRHCLDYPDNLDMLDSACADILLPVPLHKNRLRERGFNQSLELARILGKTLKRPVQPHALSRVRATMPQILCSACDRPENVRNAFYAEKKSVAQRHILLIDDIMTTGSTLEECARTLKQAGAHRVDTLVIARTAPAD